MSHPPIWRQRCKFFNDEGNPLSGGCLRISIDCPYVHPSHLAWEDALRLVVRPDGRGRDAEIGGGNEGWHGERRGRRDEGSGAERSRSRAREDDRESGRRGGRGGRGRGRDRSRSRAGFNSDATAHSYPNFKKGNSDASGAGWAYTNTADNPVSTEQQDDAGGWGTVTGSGWGASTATDAEATTGWGQPEATEGWGGGGWGQVESSGVWGEPTSGQSSGQTKCNSLTEPDQRQQGEISGWGDSVGWGASLPDRGDTATTSSDQRNVLPGPSSNLSEPLHRSHVAAASGWGSTTEQDNATQPANPTSTASGNGGAWGSTTDAGVWGCVPTDGPPRHGNDKDLPRNSSTSTQPKPARRRRAPTEPRQRDVDISPSRWGGNVASQTDVLSRCTSSERPQKKRKTFCDDGFHGGETAINTSDARLSRDQRKRVGDGRDGAISSNRTENNATGSDATSRGWSSRQYSRTQGNDAAGNPSGSALDSLITTPISPFASHIDSTAGLTARRKSIQQSEPVDVVIRDISGCSPVTSETANIQRMSIGCVPIRHIRAQAMNCLVRYKSAFITHIELIDCEKALARFKHERSSGYTSAGTTATDIEDISLPLRSDLAKKEKIFDNHVDMLAREEAKHSLRFNDVAWFAEIHPQRQLDDLEHHIRDRTGWLDSIERLLSEQIHSAGSMRPDNSPGLLPPVSFGNDCWRLSLRIDRMNARLLELSKRDPISDKVDQQYAQLDTEVDAINSNISRIRQSLPSIVDGCTRYDRMTNEGKAVVDSVTQESDALGWEVSEVTIRAHVTSERQNQMCEQLRELKENNKRMGKLMAIPPAHMNATAAVAPDPLNTTICNAMASIMPEVVQSVAQETQSLIRHMGKDFLHVLETGGQVSLSQSEVLINNLRKRAKTTALPTRVA